MGVKKTDPVEEKDCRGWRITDVGRVLNSNKHILDKSYMSFPEQDKYH